MSASAEEALREIIGYITGLLEGSTPLGGCRIEPGRSETQQEIADFFIALLWGKAAEFPIP